MKRVLVVFAIVALSTVALITHAAVSQSYSLSMPPNNMGLVGWWTFDGKYMINNVTDSSGSGTNGDLVGYTSTSSALVPGIHGQALKFNGTNQYVVAPGSAPTMTNPWTITGWVNPGQTTTTATFPSIIGFNNGTGTNRVDICLYNNTFKVCSNGETPGNGQPYAVGAWYLVTLVYDGSKLTLYENGSPDYSVTPTGNTWQASTQATFGYDFSYHSLSTIDDVRVYNRALSVSEIQQLYNMGIGTHQNVSFNPPNLQTGLVGWWTFDGKNMIQNVGDSSGNGNAGDLINFTSTTTTPGVIGQALKLNGINNFFMSANMATYLSNANPFTMSVWFDPKAPGVVVDERNAVTSPGWHDSFIEVLNGGVVKVRVWNCTAVPIGTVTFGTWNHVVLTYTAGSLGGALNGVVATPGSCTRQVPPSPIYYALGASDGTNLGSGAYFPGQVDDFRIYDRLLSSAEIQQLYNLGTATHQDVTVNPPNMDSGLVAHWTFDGKFLINNVTDSSGQGNNGALISGGAATSTMTVPGVFGQALKFNGSSQYVKGASAPISGTAAYTAAFWFKTTDARGSNTNTAVGWGTTGGTPSGSYVAFQVESGVIWGRFWGDTLYGGSGYNDGKWHQVVIVKPASGTVSNISMYVDGSPIATTSSGADVLAAGTQYPLLVGDAPGGGGVNYFNGSIDDIRIYNRALSATEVQQLYDLGR